MTIAGPASRQPGGPLCLRGTFPLLLWMVYEFTAHAATTVILKNGFDILLGSIEVTVPLVVEATDYSIIRSYLLSFPHLFIWSECMWLT